MSPSADFGNIDGSTDGLSAGLQANQSFTLLHGHKNGFHVRERGLFSNVDNSGFGHTMTLYKQYVKALSEDFGASAGTRTRVQAWQRPVITTTLRSQVETNPPSRGINDCRRNWMLTGIQIGLGLLGWLTLPEIHHQTGK